MELIVESSLDSDDWEDPGGDASPYLPPRRKPLRIIASGRLVMEQFGLYSNSTEGISNAQREIQRNIQDSATRTRTTTFWALTLYE